MPRKRSGVGPGVNPRTRHASHIARLRVFIEECRAGTAEMPMRGGRPNYYEISRLLFGTHKSIKADNHALRQLIDTYHQETERGRVSEAQALRPVQFLGAPDDSPRSRGRVPVNGGAIQTSGTDLVTSASGVPVNLSPDRYAALPFERDQFRRAMQRIEEAIARRITQRPAAWWTAFTRWRDVRTPGDFEPWLIMVLATPAIRGTTKAALPVHLLCALRQQRLLLPPLGLLAEIIPRPFGGQRVNPPVDCFTAWERQLCKGPAGNPRYNLLPYLLNIGPIVSMDEFPLEEFVTAVSRLVHAYARRRPAQSRFLANLLALSRRIDGLMLLARWSPSARLQPRIERVARESGWRGNLRPELFSLPRHPTVRIWADQFRAFVAEQRWKTPASRIQDLGRVLSYLEAREDPPALDDPALRSRLFSGPQAIQDWLEKITTDLAGKKVLTLLFKFFDWYAQRTPGFRQPLFRNEIPSMPNRGKTNKALIPRVILEEAKQICRDLLAAAWAGSARAPAHLRNARSFERQLLCRIGVKGEGFVPLLTPVVPALMFTLLTLPLRPIQARLLDSGEADEFLPVLRDGNGPVSTRIAWVRNTGPLAHPGRRQGCLRLIRDASVWKDYVGFWVNTNKTQAVGRGEGADYGYEIPWQHEELIGVLLQLRAWQERYNPLDRLYARDELTEKDLRPTDALARKMPPYAFLFRHPRDTAVSRWHEPVRYEALAACFLAILEEIELRNRGTPGEIQLILARDPRTNQPLSAIFSLHGLRVAGITAFAEAGVPAPIIAEFLAGHLTVLMTVYYEKFGPKTVTTMLNQALASLEQAELLEHPGAASDLDQLRARFVTEGNDALQAAADTTPGLWAIKLDGICPNGQTRCSDGGEKQRSSLFGPVPGGSRNCPLCRFWITGPAFLAGQVIALNALLYKLREKCEELVALHSRLRSPAAGARRAIEHSIDSVETDIDLLIRTLQARYRLAMASMQLARGADPSGRTPLVSIGRREIVQAAFTEVSDLRFLDFLSRSVEIFPELDCKSAPLRRNVLLDQLLDREGFEALLFRLPPQQAARAGNAMGALLSTLVGDEGLDDLARGSRSLRDIGIDRIEGALQMSLGTPLRLIERPSPLPSDPKTQAQSFGVLADGEPSRLALPECEGI